MQFSPLKAHASLLYTRDTQIDELGRVFHISSRLIANDIETIEIPFETNNSRRQGSIIVRLLPGFPRKRPNVLVLFEHEEEEYREFAWGEPHVRLVTIVSDIWHSLGCVESPRKKAFREDALNRLGLHMDRLGFAFSGKSGEHCGEPRSPERPDDDESIHLDGLSLDDARVPEVPFDRVESFVQSMRRDEVMAALSSRAQFNKILETSLGALARAEDKRQQNIDIAKKNSALASELKTVKQQVAIQQSEYDDKMAEFRKKYARQENARAGFGPASLIEQLQISIDQSNGRVSSLVDQWKRREMSNDVFVREYVEHQAASHARAMKYRWAKESIPIPIQTHKH